MHHAYTGTLPLKEHNMFRLFLIHGFLGSGKTTLLSTVAKRLLKKRVRVGLITNDQVPELVDTRALCRTGAAVAEVHGSCFCCNFQGFVKAISQLQSEISPDFILAEPVGSCADLAATIARPLKKRFAAQIDVRPISVVVDALRFQQILSHSPDALRSGAAYIFAKQIEEADLLVINKIDLVSPDFLDELQQHVANLNPSAPVFRISAQTGQGVELWWDNVNAEMTSAARRLEIDYDQYAAGEAELGWLNATLELTGNRTDWNRATADLLNQMQREFQNRQTLVGHVKLFLETGNAALMGNLTNLVQPPSIRGTAGESPNAILTLNARVGMEPSSLDHLVRHTLQTVFDQHHVTATQKAWQCIQPGRPKPTYRFAE